MIRSSFTAAIALSALLAAPALAQTGTNPAGASSNQPMGAAPSSGSLTGNSPSSMQSAPSAAPNTGTSAGTSAQKQGYGSTTASPGNAGMQSGGTMNNSDQTQQLSESDLQNVQQQLQHQGCYKNALSSCGGVGICPTRSSRFSLPRRSTRR
jgi:hypothetical protein